MNLTTLIKQLYSVDMLAGFTEKEIDRLKAVYGALPITLEN